MTPEILVPEGTPWERAPAVALRRAQDGRHPAQATSVRVVHDDRALRVRFDCRDRDIWATHTRRDAPLWEEEVVEVFLAPGDGVPTEYVEIEVNPLGAIFDARVASPEGRRRSMQVDAAWNAQGLTAAVERPAPGLWRATLVLPWDDLHPGPKPAVWRANFFRIERPRDGEPEFSCWVPTLVDPPDFHVPAAFGRLVLGERDRFGEARV